MKDKLQSKPAYDKPKDKTKSGSPPPDPNCCTIPPVDDPPKG